MVSACEYVNESLGFIKRREYLHWLRYRDIILYDNLHHSSLDPVLIRASNAVLATVPVCRSLGSTHFNVLQYG